MSVIYSPKGKAREYSPLALNLYTTCPHSCSYCVSGDTLVLLGNCVSKKIKDIIVGEEIYGIKKGKRFIYFKKTKVLNIWTTKQHAYKVVFENDNEIICSGNHKFFSDRGWKNTIKLETNDNKSRLTTYNYILGISRFYEKKEETVEYMKGYLSGMIRGDGLLKYFLYNNRNKVGISYMFRLALIDDEAIFRTKKYLEFFGINVNNFVFSFLYKGKRKVMNAIRTNKKDDFNKIKEIIEYKHNDEFMRGFLSGIFDAEGSYTSAIRISNNNDIIIKFVFDCFVAFGFNPIIEYLENSKKNVRLRGGRNEELRFFQLVNPSISRKTNISNYQVKNSYKIKEIIDLNREEIMYDITTDCETFLANGLVSHNCYAPNSLYKKKEDFFKPAVARKDILKNIEKDCMKLTHDSRVKEPRVILLSFVGDPYPCSFATDADDVTRNALALLEWYKMEVTVLTKGGFRACDDFDILKRNNWNFGTTLHCFEDTRKCWEPHAACVEDRIEAICEAHKSGIRTWVSMEPVIEPEEALSLIDQLRDVVDYWKVGKINYCAEVEKKVDWHKFLVDVKKKLEGREYYIKESLRKYEA